MIKLLRLFNTVRYLRLEQIYYRFYYRSCRRLVRFKAMKPLSAILRREWIESWSAPQTAQPSLLPSGCFVFLGERGEVNVASDWNSSSKSKLWLYNLHYFDDLNASEADLRQDLHAWLIERWIRDNPPIVGNGWEPYPLALRIVNLVKWFSRQVNLKPEWLSSLARQAQALYVQEERHLLANHLFVDGKALVFAGSFFGGAIGKRWLDRGLSILRDEMPVQFLQDGGNFELSPMYHSSLLWDVCDLLRLAEVANVAELSHQVAGWREVVRRGLGWSRMMSHPDGEISFFNDAAFGIAPTLAELESYAQFLGFSIQRRQEGGFGVHHLSCTGYAVIDWGYDAKAILDVGEVGPAYQPGHAHADTLSYEWSVFGQRVLVNSGTSQYGDDSERHRQRGTSAHNTVVIDETNSSEVWAGFRVARRARPFNFQIVDADDGVTVRCSHDGYLRLPGRVVHRREWCATLGRFRISDSLDGVYTSAVSRLHFHPDVRVLPEGVLLLKGGQRLSFKVVGGDWIILSSSWHPGFGCSLSNTCIQIFLTEAESFIEFEWS